VLERELGDEATVGDLLEYYTAGTLMSIRGVGTVRAAELERVLTAAGLAGGGASPGLGPGGCPVAETSRDTARTPHPPGTADQPTTAPREGG
jgi:hypothetical protein